MDWRLFVSTFGLVLVAELGDKTQLAVISQTCRYRSPWAVFLGGSLALAIVTGLGVLGGSLINAWVPQRVITIAAAVLFAVMGLLMWREASKNDCDEAEPDCAELAADAPRSRWSWPGFSSTFGLLFVAELGDKTQLAVLGLAGNGANPWITFIGGSLALATSTALAALCGHHLRRLCPERTILRVSAVLFVVMGVLMGFGVI